MKDAFSHFNFGGSYNNHRYLHDDTGVIMCYSSDGGQMNDIIDVQNNMIVFWYTKKTIQKAFQLSISNNKPLKFFRKDKTSHIVKYLGEWVVKKLDFNYVQLKQYISNES